MTTPDLFEYLEWDSSFFGIRVARIRGEVLRGDMVGLIKSQPVDCIYFLANPADALTVRLAEQNGFELVDVRVTFEKSFDVAETAACPITKTAIRSWRPADRSVLREIASVSHRGTRFYNDPRFPDPLCDKLYETWIDKSCDGYAEAVFVAVAAERPAGYITCHLRGPEGQIGLIAVASDARGAGIGQDLVQYASAWFRSQGTSRVVVVTQGANLGAMRLYERCGFFTESVRLWYHKWLLTGEPAIRVG